MSFKEHSPFGFPNTFNNRENLPIPSHPMDRHFFNHSQPDDSLGGGGVPELRKETVVEVSLGPDRENPLGILRVSFSTNPSRMTRVEEVSLGGAEMKLNDVEKRILGNVIWVFQKNGTVPIPTDLLKKDARKYTLYVADWFMEIKSINSQLPLSCITSRVGGSNYLTFFSPYGTETFDFSRHWKEGGQRLQINPLEGNLLDNSPLPPIVLVDEKIIFLPSLQIEAIRRIVSEGKIDKPTLKSILFPNRDVDRIIDNDLFGKVAHINRSLGGLFLLLESQNNVYKFNPLGRDREIVSVNEEISNGDKLPLGRSANGKNSGKNGAYQPIEKGPSGRKPEIIRINNVVLDVDLSQLAIHSEGNVKQYHLTEKQNLLLAALMRSAGNVVLRFELTRIVFGEDLDKWTINRLEQTVHRLRKRIGDDILNPRWVETYRDDHGLVRGYRYIDGEK